MADVEGSSGLYRNGPDQVIPAASFKTWDADGAVQLVLSDEEAASFKPKSVYTMMREIAEEYPKHNALAVKRGVWKYWTYKQYFEEARTVAKAFIKLGLERFHGVCIMGFNSPEWAIASFALNYMYDWLAEHEVGRRAPPSMRLRFGKRDMGWQVAQRSMPSLRLRFGKRNVDQVDPLFDHDLIRKDVRTPALRLRFGKRDTTTYGEEDGASQEQ